MKVTRTNDKYRFTTRIQPTGHWTTSVTVYADNHGQGFSKAKVSWGSYHTERLDDAIAFRDAVTFAIQEAKRIDAKIEQMENES